MKRTFSIPLYDHPLVMALLPAGLKGTNTLEEVRSRLLILAVALGLLIHAAFTIFYWWQTASVGMLVFRTAVFVAMAGCLLLLRAGTSLPVVGHLVCGVVVFLSVGLALSQGGLASGSVAYVVILPLVAFIFSGRRAAIIWAGVALMMVGVLYVLDSQGLTTPYPLDEQSYKAYWALSLGSLTGATAVVFLLADGVQRWLTDQLTEERSRLQTILETAPNGILSLNPKGQVVDANSAARALFGLPTGELVGRSIDELMEMSGEDLAELLTASKTRSDERELRRGRRASGEEFPLDVAVGQFEGGRERQAVMILRDDSEMQEMRSRMMQMDRMSAVGTLATGVAHEINNPLSYVKGNVEFVEHLLRRETSSCSTEQIEELLEALQDSLHGLERIERIVSDLRTFARRREDQMSAVDVEECLNSTLSMVETELRHRAQLKLEIDDVPPVLAEEAGLGQVLLNLLLNAVQSLDDQGPSHHRIAVKIGLEEEQVVIAVTDTGSGIDEADLPRIFDPFFTTRSSSGGTGLGLAISQSIVGEFGGVLSVESEVGEGTTFRLKLPLAPLEHLIAAEDRLPTDELPELEDARALIVDDDRRVCFALGRIVERVCEVTIATDPKVALAAVARESFDVIFVDLMMPGVSGVQFFKQLEEEDPEMAKRVIFITGGIFTPDVQEFIDARQVPVLEKPFESKRVYQRVEEVIDEIDQVEAVVSSD